MTSGGTKPPRPPAAPTSPVTVPTLSGEATLPTSADTAPLAAPSNAARPRKQIVAVGISIGLERLPDREHGRPDENTTPRRVGRH
jgi:hypothetical protein